MRFEIPLFVLTAASAAVAAVIDRDCSVCDYDSGNYEQCSEEYNSRLSECTGRGCRVFIRDPGLDCSKDQCQNPFHVCGQWQNLKECSHEWRHKLQACLNTKCIAFKRDPFDACITKDKCKQKDHPCKTYTNHKQCSETWTSDLKLCVKSGCINWIQDPFNVCKPKVLATRAPPRGDDCTRPSHPCNTYTRYPQCSNAWKAVLQRCVDSRCIQWFQDPFNVCKTGSVSKRAPKRDCDHPDHPCNTYTNHPQCSEEWSNLLKKCVASNCIQWIQDPFNVCNVADQ